MKLKLLSILLLFATLFSNGQVKMSIYTDSNFKKVFEYACDDSFQINENLFAFKKDGGWGVVTKDKQILVDNSNEYIILLTNDVIALYRGAKYALMRHYQLNNENSVVDDIKDTEVSFPLTKYIYNDVLHLNDGFFLVAKGDLWAVSSKEKIITEFWYPNVGHFKNGFAKVSRIYSGYINENGRESIPLIYDNTHENFSTSGLVAVKKNLWGVVDINNSVVIPFEYEDVKILCNNVIVVKKGGIWYIFDKLNNKKILPNIDIIEELSEKLIVIRNINEKSEYSKGVVNSDFKEIISPKFTMFHKYGNSISAFDGKYYGYFDLDGNVLIPFKYENLSLDSNKLKGFELNGRYGIVSIDNKVVFKPIYDFAMSFNDNFMLLKNNKKYGVGNKFGKITIPLMYDDISLIHGTEYFKCKKNGIMTVVDSKNKVVFSDFEDIESFINSFGNLKYTKNLN